MSLLKCFLECTSKDANRKSLCGVYYDHTNNRVVSTNGHLVFLVKDSENVNKFWTEVFQEFGLEKPEESVILYLDKKTRNMAGKPLVEKAIKGSYPSYEQAIPKEFKNDSTVYHLFTFKIRKSINKITKLIGVKDEWLQPQYWNSKISITLTILGEDNNIFLFVMPARAVKGNIRSTDIVKKINL